MELTPKEVIGLLKGAPAARVQHARVVPDRFTDLQRAGCPVGDDRYLRTFCHASVTLDFHTDADALSFAYGNVWDETYTQRCIFELWIDGAQRRCAVLPLTDDCRRTPDGTLRFALGAGEKRVTLYLTNFFHVELFDFELENATFARPYMHRGRFLAFGDSITEGFYAQTPSMTYVNRLSRIFDMEAVNYGVSGEETRPETVVPGTYPDCDFVTVAYGTNDFLHTPETRYRSSLSGLHARLHEAFPAVPVFVLLPLWRSDADRQKKPLGTLRDLSAAIAASAAHYPNFRVIDCFDFVPHAQWAMADALRVHPNEQGMAIYAENLAAALRKELHI